jgi:endoglucanase
MLHRLAASGEDVDVAVILTRAEEAGFCGLLCLLDEPRLPALVPGDTIFVSVEISREMPSVRLGEGAVIRAGDRSSTFDGRVTDTLAGLAAANGIVARRALMDGGTCEATAFARAGLRTGGVCAPVRGYHNQDPESHHVVAEQVALADLIALEALCRGLAVACNRGEQAPVGASIPFDRFLAKGRRELLSLPSESPAHQPVS